MILGAFELAIANLTSPMVLFFGLGLFAALMRSDLSVPEAVAKTMALYLMLAIGFKGGAELARSGVDAGMIGSLLAGMALSFAIPVIGFLLLSVTSTLPRADAAAVAAHYGSISIVTFVAATETVRAAGFTFEGHLIAIAAAMETPAILAALFLARSGPSDEGEAREPTGRLLREVAFNGSVVMLVGAFLIGWISGEKGYEAISPFITDPFRGILCLFLLDMGLVAGRGLIGGWRHLRPPVLAFGIYFPLISALLAAGVSMGIGLSVGGTALFVTLAASASYIAVPAAMRIALPEARPAVYLTLSLGVTFPFNLTIGLPLYLALAERIAG